MNISARCEYACRAVVELARLAHTQSPVTAAFIAQKRAIPEKYLVHIMLQLKRARIVQSIRGAQGGYMLARSAESITLLDVVTAVDGAPLDPLPVSGVHSGDIAPTWREVSQQVSNVLDKVTIRSIMDRSATGDMYFI